MRHQRRNSYYALVSFSRALLTSSIGSRAICVWPIFVGHVMGNNSSRRSHDIYRRQRTPDSQTPTLPKILIEHRWEFQNITDEQIHQAIQRMKPYKASRSRTVSNSVLLHAREELVPNLALLYRATNTLLQGFHQDPRSSLSANTSTCSIPSSKRLISTCPISYG
jgi:hypothetical protein